MEPTTPAGILKQYWGYDQFRSPQEEIVLSVLAKKDTLALLPTGGGKSVCFQVPAMMMEGLCIVITPLIALMQDQVQQLRRRGIKATAVNSGQTREEIDIALDNCVYGQEKFLYVSPERLQTELFQVRVRKMKVCLIAIDEAHCISQWGYDFRPSYLQLALLRELLPDVPFIALTASATKAVKEDIILQLKMKSPAVFQKSFARPNLAFVVRHTENKERKMLEILRKVQGPSIVYVRSRKATQEFCRFLLRQKIRATFYHAGLTHAVRKERQEEWIASKVRVMVATNAFGMGIDKPDVRTVIHMDLPENLESYYQEAGRGGRDGNKSYATILYHTVDVQSLEHKTELAHPEPAYLKTIYQALASFYQIAVGSAGGEAYEFDIEKFAKRFEFKSTEVFVALKKLEEEGLIELSDSFYRPSRIHFTVDKTKLYEFQVANEKYDPFLKVLLRLYGGELFSDFMDISETQIAAVTQAKERDVKSDLQKLSKLQLLTYEPATDSPRITFILPRQDPKYLPLNLARLSERKTIDFQKMKAMIHYTEQTNRCRMQVIQDYFDETTWEVCGLCDVCIDRRKKENLAALDDYQSQILYLLHQHPATVEKLEEDVAPDDHELFLEVVRDLVDRGVIAYDDFWVLKAIINY